MCGIFGCDQITDVTKPIMSILAWEMEGRGKDAWGATDGQNVIKHLGPITESWKLPMDWTQGIFHTRSASTGTATNVENAHPFIFQKENGSNLIGIHNGIVRTHEALNKKHNRDFQVDSMHIFAHLAQNLDLEEIEGYGALAWYEDGLLNFARFNTTDLYIALLETGEIVFCSRQDPIRRASKMFGSGIKTEYKIEERKRYWIAEGPDGGRCLWGGENLPFAERTVAHIPQTSGRQYFNHTHEEDDVVWSGYGGSYQGSRVSLPRGIQSEDKCWMCGTKYANRAKHMLCWLCMEKEIETFKMECKVNG